MVLTEKATLVDARELTEKWAPKFGFGGYRWKIATLSKTTKGRWGQSVWLHDDDFFEIRVQENVLPLRQMEALVIHELTHGLLTLAQTGQEERVCNRLPRLLMGDTAQTANIWALARVDSSGWGEDEGLFIEPTDSEVSPYVTAALPLIVDDLTPREAAVINAVYWEGASLMEAARRLGISRRQAGRLHKSALAHLRGLVDGLKEALPHG